MFPIKFVPTSQLFCSYSKQFCFCKAVTPFVWLACSLNANICIHYKAARSMSWGEFSSRAPLEKRWALLICFVTVTHAAQNSLETTLMEVSLSEWDVLCVAFIFLYEVNTCPKYPKVLFFFHLDSFAHLQMDRDQNKHTNKKKQKNPSNDQSVKLTRPASLSEGQAFWLFEGRIGWGSCKLPNNLSAQLLHSARYHYVPCLSGSHRSFWCWSFPWLSHILKKALLFYTIIIAELTVISKNRSCITLTCSMYWM